MSSEDLPDGALRDAARRAIACLDLTSLNDGDDDAAVTALCERARTPAGPVAAVCIWPQFVPTGRRLLDGSGIKVCTVVNFPHGRTAIDPVRREIGSALNDGADEIDIVLPYTALLSGRPDEPRAMLEMARDACGTTTLKVILETGRLATAGAISEAASLAVACGADFLKTSTGKTAVSATLESAHLLLDAAAGADRPVGVKVAGGVRTTDQAAAYLRLADAVNGPASPANFRFGASGLLGALLQTLGSGADAPTAATAY